MNLKSIMKVMVGALLLPAIVCCQEALEKRSSLTVEPSSGLVFEAQGNASVEIIVTTDADEWDFTAPQWAGAVKSEDGTSLIITPSDYDGAVNRLDRIVFTAGNAYPVKLNIVQYASTSSQVDVTAQILNVGGEVVALTSDKPVYNGKVKVTLDKAVAVDLNFVLGVDLSFVEEYAYLNNMHCSAPTTNMAKPVTVTVPAGRTESEEVAVELDATNATTQLNYIISLAADKTKLPKGVKFEYGRDRATWRLVKRLPKDVKNIVWLEVNNTNPLNMLEYKLEDGSPFFDVVVLFAANIRYDAEQDIVYLHNNENVQALLNDTDIYIQPLREAGMEVQLGLLCDHTPAGLINLTNKGADMFAQDVANALVQYKLDGVAMDNEYREGTATTDLIAAPTMGPEGGMYLSWKIKQLCKAKGQDCKVSVFSFGWGYMGDITVDGTRYNASDCVDIAVHNYWGTEDYTTWGTGFSAKNCSGRSMECNLSYSLDFTYNDALNLKNEGFGWCMWFAFHPQVGGGLTNNATRMDPIISDAARAFYGMSLATPTGYYTKLGPGMYDPKRYERTWN